MHVQLTARETATEKDNHKAEAAQISGGKDAASNSTAQQTWAEAWPCYSH